MQQVTNVPNSLLELRTLPSNAQHLADLRQQMQDGLLSLPEYQRLSHGLQVHQPYDEETAKHLQFRSPVHAQ